MRGESSPEIVEVSDPRAPHLAPEKTPSKVPLSTLVLSWVLALVVGLATAALLRSVAPVASAYPNADRLGYYLEHPEDFDTLFVGTSRVLRGIVPNVFDARMAELGHPTRSLNLGEPGLRAYEIDRLVRLLLKRNQGHLETLLVDPGMRSPREEQETRRSVEWHTLRQTLAALRASGALGLEGAEYAALQATHVRQLAMRYSNYGFGPELWSRMQWAPPSAPGWLAYRGYKSLEGESRGSFRRRRKRFLERQDRYLRAVARYRDRPPDDSAENRLRLAQWRNQARMAREVGVLAVALVAPGYGRLAVVEAEDLGGMPLLNFDDAARYPELFEPSSRFDAVHLNSEAARVYTRMVADALAAELEGGVR